MRRSSAALCCLRAIVYTEPTILVLLITALLLAGGGLVFADDDRDDARRKSSSTSHAASEDDNGDKRKSGASSSTIIEDSFSDSPGTPLGAHSPLIDDLATGWQTSFGSNFAIDAAGGAASDPTGLGVPYFSPELIGFMSHGSGNKFDNFAAYVLR